MNYFKTIMQISEEGLREEDKKTIKNFALSLPINRLRRVIGKSLSVKFPRDVYLKNEDGVFYCNKEVGFALTSSVTYEPKLRKHFDIKEGVFIDVGANIGKYSIMIGHKLKKGKVISIEPEKNNFKILKKNISLNKLNNVIPINAICSNKEGKQKLFLKERDRGGHSIKEDFGHGHEEIESVTIDSIVEKRKITEINLIKVDVEGAELDVLKGAEKTLTKYFPMIVFESREENDLEDIREFLSKFKYEIKKIDERNYIAK